MKSGGICVGREEGRKEDRMEGEEEEEEEHYPQHPQHLVVAQYFT